MNTFLAKGCGLIVVAGLIAAGCASADKTADARPAVPETPVGAAVTAPKAIVYATRADYSANVAVTLSDDRQRIASYPDPKDVSPERSTPVKLSNGYLLDRRGIGRNTAFLSYTYEEYSRLDKAPSRDSLMHRVIDKTPITAMYSLPITATQARKNPSLCEEYIANGFKGCQRLTVVPL